MRDSISTDPPLTAEIWRQLTEKYSGPVTPAETANFSRQASKRYIVTVDVENMISRDHRKTTTPPVLL